MTGENPTATEFIPDGEYSIGLDEGDGVRYLQLRNGDLEIVNKEPYDDEVLNHVIVCDECGQQEDRERRMAQHLKHSH